MAQQTISRGLWIPNLPTGLSGGPSHINGFIIDAADEAVAFMCHPPKAGAIRKVGFRIGTVTTGATITVGIYQSDDATGRPVTPHTAWATNTFGTLAVTTGDALKWVWVTLTADATVAKNDQLSVLFINPTASFGNMSPTTALQDTSSIFPFTSHYTGTWSAPGGNPVAVAFEYSDGTVGIPLGGFAVGTTTGTAQPTTTSYSSSSTPDVWGLRFQFPYPVRLVGGFIWGDLDGPADIVLANSAWDGVVANALTKYTYEVAYRSGTAGNIYLFEFDTAQWLTANTYYRVLLVPGVSVVALTDYHVPDDATLVAQPLGNKFHLTSAKDPNDDTDFTNYDNGTDGRRVPYMGLLIDGGDDGAGGGGGGDTNTGSLFNRGFN